MKNEWIPVEKALPKRGEYAFVVTEPGGWDTAEYLGRGKWDADNKVTHWFPIPDYSAECEAKFQEEYAQWKKENEKNDRPVSRRA